MEWNAVLLAAIGVGGTLGGVWLGGRQQAKTAKAERDAAYCQKHRDDTTKVLGELEVTLLRTLASWVYLYGYLPDNGVAEYQEATGTPEALAVHKRLAEVTASHPSEHVRAELTQLQTLISEIDRHVMNALWAKHHSEPAIDSAEEWVAAEAAYEKTEAQRFIVIDCLQADVDG